MGEEKWATTEQSVDQYKSEVSGKNTEYEGKKGEHAGLVEKGQVLVSYEDRRELWIEMHRAVNECLPRAIGDERDEEDIRRIRRLNVLSVKTKRYADLKTWFESVPDDQKQYSLSPEEREKGPTGPGYVVTIVGEHFYTPENKVEGSINFVIDTILNDLKKPFVRQQETLGEPVPVAILGISHPILVDAPPAQAMLWYPKGPPKSLNPGRAGFGAANRRPHPGANAVEDKSNQPIEIERTTFTIQFAWKPTMPADRVNPEEKPATDGGDQTPQTPTSPGTPTNPAVPATNPAVPAGTPTNTTPTVNPTQGTQPGQVQPGQVQPGNTPQLNPTGVQPPGNGQSPGQVQQN